MNGLTGLTSAFLALYLITLPAVAYLDFRERETRALKVVNLYASLVPVAALPKLLEIEVAEPFVAAACMSAVAEALLPDVEEGADALFDLVFYVAVAWFGAKMPCWARLGGVLAASANLAVFVSLFGTPEVEGIELVEAAGGIVFFVGMFFIS